MNKFICVHGHFYQPPRENPWLEAIELQDSAYPYHDWNERITAECYATNGASRILDAEGYIVKIVNNYSRISFNFGPTLLSWMEAKSPDVYRSILKADQESLQLYSGHGSALAQTYNHIIMPLANPRDKYTQVYWGIRDFETRFQRRPEGMWLPETAVDLETLDLMAGMGIKFSILAPHQASQVRKIGARTWKDISGAQIDPTRAYQLSLPSGRTIALFFYDGPISRAVAFEHLLNRGEDLANRLIGAFHSSRTWPQMVHIATDGETYGHHHRFGDMALAYALDYIERNSLARLTNYGEFLEIHPPTHEVQIFENTSWSCIHGVERWRSNCGCWAGSGLGRSQAWRAPLRAALDWLRDTLAPKYEAAGKELFEDPWRARNNYIDVLLDRSTANIYAFLEKESHREMASHERIRALKLLELERQAMLMYTSCGWFFNEISGIETVQILQYAARAIQLAKELFGDDWEPQFKTMLEAAPSNIPDNKNGRAVYEKYVEPAAMDLFKVGAHYAISSLFDGEQAPNSYCYNVTYDDYQSFSAGKTKLAIGQMQVSSLVTQESVKLVFGITYFGDHNLNGGVSEYGGEEPYKKMVEEVVQIFNKADFSDMLRWMDRHFRVSSYSLKTLFSDEQRRIMDSILAATLSDIEADYRQIYENNVPLMRFLSSSSIPLPKALLAAAEFIINVDLRRAIENEEMDLGEISRLLADSKNAQVGLDKPGLAYALRKNLWRMAEDLVVDPSDGALLTRLVSVCEFVPALPFEVDFWRIQNIYYDMLKTVYPAFKEQADRGDAPAVKWVEKFLLFGNKLRVRTYTV